MLFYGLPAERQTYSRPDDRAFRIEAVKNSFRGVSVQLTRVVFESDYHVVPGYFDVDIDARLVHECDGVERVLYEIEDDVDEEESGTKYR